jgi:transcriptional regulator with XRE-family HTH domain
LQPLDAERVKEWRRRRMLSQQEVADRAGTSLFTIQRIERGEGNVRPKTGRGVATALGVPVEELLPKVQSPLPLEYEVTEPRRARDIDEAAKIFEENIRQRVEQPGALEVALEAAGLQAKQDAQAANRTLASEGIQQPAYFKDYENDAVAYLMQLDKDKLASALLDMAAMVVQLKARPERGSEASSEATARSAPA